MEYSEKTSYNRGGEVSKALLRRYYQYLKLERGLSGNTLDAYTEDLRKLLGFLWEGGLDFRTVSVDDLHQFMAELADVGIGPRSMARILSGIRSFSYTWRKKSYKTQRNCLNLRKSDVICRKF